MPLTVAASRIVWCLLASAAVVGFGCAPEAGVNSASQPEATRCQLPAPQGFDRTFPGDVHDATATRRGDIVGFVSRDASVTVIGFCTRREGLPGRAPVVVDDRGTLEPNGGMFEQVSDGNNVNYLFYPPSTDTTVHVRHRGTAIGTASFARAVDRSCSKKARPPFRFIACDSLYVLEWQTGLPYRARNVEGVDARVSVVGNPRKDLGFYSQGTADGRNGLIVRFGFRRTKAEMFRVELRNLYVDHAGRIEELGRPMRHPVELSIEPSSRKGTA